MDLPNILFFEPNRVWRTYLGGRTLDQNEGKAKPEDSHFPEDWIGSTTLAKNKGREQFTEEGLSKITINGETLTLKALFEKEPDSLLGPEHAAKYGANTQFLLKLLDSSIRLHIQCHPTIPFAQKYLNSNNGKTEAYLILGIRDEVSDPYIYMGFQHLPEKDAFKHAIKEQDSDAILSCFDKIPIKPGDVFMVPGGMPHAIGEGVFMIEIMEPTDFAVRIEYERGGYVLPEESRFMNRGIDFGLSVFNYDTTSIETIKDEYFCKPRLVASQGTSAEYVLIDADRTPCFRVNRISVNGRYDKAEDSFYSGIVSKGSGSLNIGRECWDLPEGSKFLVPYQTETVTFESEKGMEIVVTLPPI